MKINDLALNGIIAAVYFVLTTVLAPISFGAVQLRLSEALCLLVAYNPKYFVSIVIGTALANLMSPLGLIDVVFGTGATAIALGIAILINKRIESINMKKFIVIICMAISMIIIAIELNIIYATPVFYTFIVIALGEAGALIVGFVLTHFINKKIDLSTMGK